VTFRAVREVRLRLVLGLTSWFCVTSPFSFVLDHERADVSLLSHVCAGQSDSTSVDSCFAELQDEMDMNALHEPGVAQGFSFPGGSSESAAKPARVPRRKAADHHSAHRRYQSDPGPLNGLFTDVLPRGGSHFDFLNSPPATNGFGIGFDQDHRRVGSSESINSSESQNDQTGAQNWLGPTDTLDSSMESQELGYDNDRENDSDSMAGSLDSLPHDPKTDFSDLQVEGVGMPLPPLPRTDSGDAYFFRHHHMPAKAREQPGSEPGVRRGRNGLTPPSQTMQPPQSRSLRAGISNSDARNHKAVRIAAMRLVVRNKCRRSDGRILGATFVC